MFAVDGGGDKEFEGIELSNLYACCTRYVEGLETGRL